MTARKKKMPPRKTRGPIRWFSDLSPIMKGVAVVSAICGVIVAIPGAFLVLASPVHHYVDGRVDIKLGPIRIAFDSTDKVVRDLQLEAAEGKLSATKDNIAKWELELSKTTSPSARELIQKQLRENEGTRGKLEQQLNTLRAVRAPKEN